MTSYFNYIGQVPKTLTNAGSVRIVAEPSLRCSCFNYSFHAGIFHLLFIPYFEMLL